jgi:hypothetical protein
MAIIYPPSIHFLHYVNPSVIKYIGESWGIEVWGKRNTWNLYFFVGEIMNKYPTMKKEYNKIIMKG